LQKWTRGCSCHGEEESLRKHTWSGILTATVFAATVGIGAQSSPTPQNSPEPTPAPQAEPQAQTPQPPATAPAQKSEARHVTVAGCLQEAPSSPTGTSGSAAAVPPAATDGAAKPAATSGEVKLVLANAVPSPAGAAAGAAASSAPMTYQLIANEGALKPHVGKKLELTGTVEEDNPASTANGPKLRVEAGKVVSDTCTQ